MNDPVTNTGSHEEIDYDHRVLRNPIADRIRVMRAAPRESRRLNPPASSDPATDPVATSFAFVLASAVATIDPRRGHAVAAAARHPLDPAALLQLARWHRIMPMVQRAVAETGAALPDETVVAINAEARAAQIAALFNASEEARVATAARARGIDALFVKGATLGHLLYAEPSIKSSWDIDLLIAPTDQARASAMLRDLGFVMDDPQGIGPGRRLDRWIEMVRETTWRHPQRGTTVELHVSLSETPAVLPGMGLASPRQEVMVAGAAVPTLAQEELFAYLCVHGTHHGWARLKWLIDVAALIHVTEHDAATLRAIAIDRGAGRCGDVALILCHELLGIAVPADLLATMRADAGTRKIVAYSHSLIDRTGDPNRQLAASNVGEGIASMRNLLRHNRGLATQARTWWMFLNRPYGTGQLWFPKVLRPVVTLGWLPWRALRRAVVGGSK